MSLRTASQSRLKRPVRAKSLISQLRKVQNPLEQKLLLLGYVTDRLEKRKQHVYLVGGQAVETYTAGQFTTGDIDITTTDAKATEKVLKSLGFEQVGMIWLNKQLGIAVQIVGLFPSGDLEKTLTIQAGPYHVKIIGVEDLIIDRLSAAKHWKSPGDMEKAKVLYTNFKRQIDQKYLKESAKKKGVEDFLEQARELETLSPKSARQ